MSRQSTDVNIDLKALTKIRIGGQDVILTCEEKGDKLPVKEIYVSKSTGRLVIVYDDGE